MPLAFHGHNGVLIMYVRPPYDVTCTVMEPWVTGDTYLVFGIAFFIDICLIDF